MKPNMLCLLTIVCLSSCLNPGNKKDTAKNRILIENLLPGTTDWLISVKQDTCSLPDHRFCRRPQVEGYVSQTSVSQGDSLNLYVSTSPSSQFTIDIYRMGYYNGKGGNLKKSIGPLTGIEQHNAEPDPKTNFLECKWALSYQLVI